MQDDVIREQLEAIASQLDAVQQQVRVALSMLPCMHEEVEIIPGSTMGNAQYRCKRCGEVVMDNEQSST